MDEDFINKLKNADIKNTMSKAKLLDNVIAIQIEHIQKYYNAGYSPEKIEDAMSNLVELLKIRKY